MWAVIWAVVLAVFFAFVFVVAFGAPFLPTLKQQVPQALDLIDLKPGQTLLELGSGDGRVLAAAAERGINAVGYELNPLLVLYSRLKTRKYGKKVRVVWGNYWKKKLPPADGIFVFLLNPYMQKLDNKITQEFSDPVNPVADFRSSSPRGRTKKSVKADSSKARYGVKLVSFAFEVPNRKPVKQQKGLYLYQY